MRRPLIIGNWKMNTTLADATVLATTIKNGVGDLDVEVVLCPPFVWLYPVAEIIEKGPKNLHLGAQNMWFEDKGALTGEISPLMLKNLVDYVILGHSERRAHFEEDNELIGDKVHAAIRHGIKPIIAVGELKKMATTKKGKGRPSKIELKSDLLSQLKEVLEGISKEDAEKIIFTYEPVWAISTSKSGEAADGAYAAEVIGKMRNFIAKKYNQAMSERAIILYGGSVDAQNITEYIYHDDIDGALVGAASLKAKEFIEICKQAAGRD